MPGSPKAVDKRSVSDMYGDFLRQNYEGDSKAGEILNDIKAGTYDVDNWFSKLPVVKQVCEWLEEDYYKEKVISLIVYSPAAIFANMVPALDVNFINPNVWYQGGQGKFTLVEDERNGLSVKYEYNKSDAPSTDEEKFSNNTAYQLQGTIATWYVALRNIAIVGLLSVLVYVAIRIIMSSTAGETAKYKSMLKDWLIAMCILFFMHYMMAFLLKATEMITGLFTTNTVVSNVSSDSDIEVLGDKYMNNTRADAEEYFDEEDEEEEDILAEFGYTLIYIILIFYTLIFTWKYLKRFVYLAFLTMISPMVALTYPIDKLKDGSAQAFNMWFKEYVFNVLIQPIHLLLYTILITSASDFAEKNMIYTIVAIGFMLEAEKIVKSMFGFNKAEGGELSSAITGGAIFGTVAGLMKSGASRLPGGSKGKGGSGGGGSDGGKVRYNQRTADRGMPSGLEAFRNSASGTQRIGGTTRIGGRPSGLGTGSSTRATGGRKVAGVSGGNIGGSALSGLKRGAGSVAKLSGRTIKGAFSGGGRFIGRNGKKIAKLAAMGAGAATLGTIGLAAGIASDKSDDVLKFAGAGLATGAFAGGKAFDAVPALAKGVANEADTTVDDFKQGFYGVDYVEKALNPKLDKEWKSDKDVKKHFQHKYGEKWQEKMQDAMEFRKRGITDQKEIDKGIALMKDKYFDFDKASVVLKMANKVNADILTDQAKCEKFKKDQLSKKLDSKTSDKVMEAINKVYFG